MNLLDIIACVENWLNNRYQNSPMARQAGKDKLTQTRQSAKSDAEKITMLKEEFPEAFTETAPADPVENPNGTGEDTDKVKQTPFDAEALCKTGIQYAEAENPEKAVACFRKAAEQGHADAQYRLGECYDEGRGVERDLTEAAGWYRKAAEQGHADAQYRLGECYAEGEGVGRDPFMALRWWRSLDDEDHLSMLVFKADSYINSGFWSKLFDKQKAEFAVELYRIAAQQGSVTAQYSLAECYFKGDGVKRNFSQAKYLYRKVIKKVNDAAAAHARQMAERLDSSVWCACYWISPFFFALFILCFIALSIFGAVDFLAGCSK